MNKRLFALFACLVPFALIAAGCGSSDNTETTATTSALTRAEFLKQGNAICAQGNTEIEKGFNAFLKENPELKKQKPTTAQDEEIAENILIPGVTKQVEGIRALGAPEGDEEQVEAILDAADEAIEEVEADPVAAVSENNPAFAKANKLANEYGLTTCGEEGGEGNEKG